MRSFEEILEITEETVKQIAIADQPQNLYDPIKYSLAVGGKRVRPMALLLAAGVYNDDLSGALPAAMAVELFHNFTLLHDDIMDNAPTRRGRPTVHTKWSQSCAILSGDAMMILAYRELSHCPVAMVPQLLRVFNEVAMGVCEGQQLDMDYESLEEVSVEQYIKMIELKTAVLLGGALKMGALCGGADSAQAQKLYEFGINIGIAFQLQDDLLDTYADPKEFGKKIGGDILCGKKTFLLTTALNNAKPEIKKRLKYLIADQTIDHEQKIAQVTEIYNLLDIKTETQKEINSYFDTALATIDKLSVDPKRLAPLKELASKLLNRKK